MRVFAVSDLHVDHERNASWLMGLSRQDYRDDALILAGDISNSLRLIETSLYALAERFRHVFYVPGNHELWVARDAGDKDSFDKFQEVQAAAANSGATLTPFFTDELSILPLQGWYDYSFGEPNSELKAKWMDFRACRWPAHLSQREIALSFTAMNEPAPRPASRTIISFSHFLPRIDLMPSGVPQEWRYLYPVLGTDVLERQIRESGATLHVYGHSHINRQVTLDGIVYVNNAFGYPSEARFTARRLLCIHGQR